jgi:GNAT superfamily N-acetyltransferase
MISSAAPVRFVTDTLSADEAERRFAGLLAPSLAFRRRHGLVAEQVVSVVATLDGQPAGVALGGIRPGTGFGEVLCLNVAADVRRLGIGSGLLARLERGLADTGCRAVQGTFRSDWGGADATTGLLAAAGWDPPVVQKLYYKIRGSAFMSQPVMQSVPTPEGYEITDWDTLTEADRAHVEALVAADPATAALTPFQHPGAVSPEFSVWLRHGGEIVGWHLVLVASRRAVEYAGLYVTPEHRRSRSGLALVAASGWRHIAVLEQQAEAGFGTGEAPISDISLFAVEPQSREMRAFADAYFRRDGITETTVWLAGKRLGAV